MKTDGRRAIPYLTTVAWLITKGLKSRRLNIAKVVFITAAAVIELSILVWLTSGIIRVIAVSITFVLFVLAISEVIGNAILRRADRVRILMAFGAKRVPITISLLIESAISSLLGSLIGSVMGLIVMYILHLPAADLALHPSSMILPFSLGFVTNVMACIYPILKITKPSASERY
ncbi:MAG: FtsX-like permease family protein [Candidatus Bathyarchaeia archaeon]